MSPVAINTTTDGEGEQVTENTGEPSSSKRKSSLASIMSGIGSFAGQITRRMSLKAQTAREVQLDLTTQPKFLLLGPEESGKTTLSKQMKMLYGVGYDETDRKSLVREIRLDVLYALVYLVRQANEIDPELTRDYTMYLQYEQRDDQSELLHDGMLSSCATLDAPTTAQISYSNYEEYLEHSDKILNFWESPAIKELANRLPEGNNRWK